MSRSAQPGFDGDLSTATLFFLTAGARLQERDDGPVVIGPASGSAYALSEVGASIASALRRPASLDSICAAIVAEYDVSPGECAVAVREFLDRLDGFGLLVSVHHPAGAEGLRRRYLDLLKLALVNLIYPESELRLSYLEENRTSGDRRADERALRDIRYAQPDEFSALVRAKQEGLVWRQRVTRDSHTMVGLRRLENLECCAVQVFANDVPGDFLEAGVCQGGASIFLRALQVAYDQEDRRTWAADSFQGLPPPTHPIDRQHRMDFSEPRQPWLSASLEAVKDNFRTYDLLSDNVRFLPGWFADTLPDAPTGELSLLRLDGDLYSSTYDALSALYPRVSTGGFVVIDDYWAFEPCRLAVDTFLSEQGAAPELLRIDWIGVCWQKT